MTEIPLDSLINLLFDGVYYVDPNKRITRWNKAAEKISGYQTSEVIGSCCSDNMLRHINDEGEELCLSGCPLSATLKDGQQREAKVYLHHKRGHRVPVSVRVAPVTNTEGSIIGAIEIFADESADAQSLQEIEKIRHEAYTDKLTNVSNRRYGEIKLQDAFLKLKANGSPFCVAFMDIDGMKRCNDTYGHQTGDEVLVMVSRVIADLLRRTDTIMRWGGDEFVLILPDISTQQESRKILERIRVFIERSFIMAEPAKLAVTMSIGATMAMADDTPESIIQRADGLMYLSKTQGKNRVEIG